MESLLGAVNLRLVTKDEQLLGRSGKPITSPFAEDRPETGMYST